MHSYKRRKKRPNYGIRTVEVARGQNGFGFTISGQQPCILSCIVTNSPADNAGLRAGDFLISVNGLNVSKLPHDSVVQLIGNANGTIKMAIAENYYSDSSDEDIINSINFVHRPNLKQPQKVRSQRLNRSNHRTTNDVSLANTSTLLAVSHETDEDFNGMDDCRDLGNVSTIVCKDSPSKIIHNTILEGGNCNNLELHMTNENLENTVLEYHVFVGYLGTIEMPKHIIASSKLQTLRGCIRRLRQEKRTPATVLMTIQPSFLTLKNENHKILAKYPASRLSYVSCSSEKDKKFFGLVTSAIYANGEVCEINFNGVATGRSGILEKDSVSNVECLCSNDIITVSNSCHIFMIDTKLTDHDKHIEKASAFNITCTKDMISNICLEFPNTSEYIVNIIQSMYNLNLCSENLNSSELGKTKKITSPVGIENGLEVQEMLRNVRLDMHPNEVLHHNGNDFDANSPQPSNHSEVTTSSNSDSGIGFHNDCSNITDRILVVDFPVDLSKNIQRSNLLVSNNRPQGIDGDSGFKSQQCCSIDSDKLIPHTVNSMSMNSSQINCSNISEDNINYRLNVRAMLNVKDDDKLKDINCANISSERIYETVYSPRNSRCSFTGSTAEEFDIFSERPIDVPCEKFINFDREIALKNLSLSKSHSCYDMEKLVRNPIGLSVDNLSTYGNRNQMLHMIPTKSEKNHSGNTILQECNFEKQIDNEFLDPNKIKSCKSYKKKKPSTFKKMANNDTNHTPKSKTRDALLNYKLSPQVFGLTRPSVSCESLDRTNVKSVKRRSGVPFDEWGSLWKPNARKEFRRLVPLEGTLSEPDLRYAEKKCVPKESGTVCSGSPFRRWGSSSSSLKSRSTPRAANRYRRPTSIAASDDHDMYTKDPDGTSESDASATGGNGGVASWSVSFERLLADTAGIHAFAEFLKKEFSHENIYFWTACERYRRLDRQADREQEAREIFEAHLADGASEPVNVDAQARQCAQDGLQAADKDLFSQAQKQIFNLMKFDSYPRFLRSDLHRQCVNAEASHKRLPFPIDNKADEKLRTGPTHQTPSKLKKSLSNAEDRRRKSLMPWHRKTRCKSKDRGEQDYKGNQGSSLVKQSALSASNTEVHSSIGSLASWDAALNKQIESPFDDTQIPDAMPNRCTLCRVVLSDESTALLQTQPNDSVRQLIDRLLEKRGIRYRAYEVHISGTNKPLNVIDSSRILAGKVVVVEQRVVFKLDLPNKKVISVKSKITKTLGEVLRPILHKYNYKLDLVQVLIKAESTESLDMSKSVLIADGQRLLIQCRPEGWIGEVTQISTAGILGTSSARLKLEMAMNAKTQEPYGEGASLNEITNRVFEELLQGKSEAQNQKMKSLDQNSIKSEDCGSETSSGIFSRFLRRDTNMPSKSSNSFTKKYNQFTSKSNKIPTADDPVTESRKPLIAKWKPGAKIQVTGRQSESDELLEGLNRAQRARLEDQRGTEINFELPDFLKDSDNLQSCSKLRKILTTDNAKSDYNVDSNMAGSENVDLCKSKNINSIPTPTVRLSPGHKPNPAPRLSIGRIQNTPCDKIDERRTSESQVQIKINALEKCSSASHISSNSFISNNFSRSPTKNNNNSEKDVANQSKLSGFENQKISKDYLNQNQKSININENSNNDILNCSFQSNSSSESDKLKNGSDPPPLPPKPKVLPMKPSNWGQNISPDMHFKTSQERLRNSNTENILKRAIYLDQHNSSFV